MIDAFMNLFFEEPKFKKVQQNPREIEFVMSEEFLPKFKHFMKDKRNVQKIIHTAQENNVKCFVLNYNDNLSGGEKMASVNISMKYPIHEFEDIHHYFSVMSFYDFEDKFSQKENEIFRDKKLQETLDFMVSEDSYENIQSYETKDYSCKDLF